MRVQDRGEGGQEIAKEPQCKEEGAWLQNMVGKVGLLLAKM